MPRHRPDQAALPVARLRQPHHVQRHGGGALLRLHVQLGARQHIDEAERLARQLAAEHHHQWLVLLLLLRGHALGAVVAIVVIGRVQPLPLSARRSGVVRVVVGGGRNLLQGGHQALLEEDARAALDQRLGDRPQDVLGGSVSGQRSAADAAAARTEEVRRRCGRAATAIGAAAAEAVTAEIEAGAAAAVRMLLLLMGGAGKVAQFATDVDVRIEGDLGADNRTTG